MHLNPVHMAMALLATSLATAFPVQSMNPQFSLEARAPSQTVSCAGSSACSIALSSTLSWACNRAHTKIDPTATYMTGRRTRDTGVCARMYASAFGCGIFVSGPRGCSRSGAEMIQAVSDIRTSGKCAICGWVQEKSGGDGCKIKIDYVSGC
ncbi:hypothetical protein N7541_005816 [Penicillium brevicompactum]|uniref:Uncharacterized protein n=1 Tax=Penicillium brevicompactum TaxID=5074 RepID=A0A9W9R6V7_PENBR|nr:hypothetical protein N7541_005816 [Penicillium brevicompactum]